MSHDPTSQLPIRELPPAEPAPPVPRPRLSIAHLMLWTLGTAIVLALSRLEISAFETPGYSFFGESYDRRLQTYFRVMAIVTAPFTGIAVAFLLASIWKLYHKQPLWLVQPGHWILLTGAVAFLLTAVGQLIQFLLTPLAPAEGGSASWFFLTQSSSTVLSLVMAGMNYVAWRRSAGPPRWRFYFASSAVLYAYAVAIAFIVLAALASEALMNVMFVFAIIALPIYLACLVSFPYAVLRDLALKEYRDALHWAGVALAIVAVVSAVGQVVALSVLA